MIQVIMRNAETFCGTSMTKAPPSSSRSMNLIPGWDADFKRRRQS